MYWDAFKGFRACAAPNIKSVRIPGGDTGVRIHKPPRWFHRAESLLPRATALAPSAGLAIILGAFEFATPGAEDGGSAGRGC